MIPSQKKIPFALTLSHTFKKLGWGLRTRGRECVCDGSYFEWEEMKVRKREKLKLKPKSTDV